MQSDVADPRSVRSLFNGAVDVLGVPDVLVANAGVAISSMPVAEMDDSELDLVIRINLMWPLYCARAFIKAPSERKGGRIVFIISVAGRLPTPKSAPYGMSKAGLNSLVRSLSRELAGIPVSVNAVAPGLIATPMTQRRLDEPDAKAKSMKAIPWSREGRPEEIAGLAVFLAFDAADYVTGQTWTMDGGLTMNWGGA